MVFSVKYFVLTAPDGAAAAAARLEFPVPAEGGEEDAAFRWAERVSEECESFARSVLCERACAAYAADPSAEKRFSFRKFVYSLSFSEECGQGIVSLSAHARLERAGILLAEGSREERFCGDGILPRRGKHRSRKKRRDDKKSKYRMKYFFRSGPKYERKMQNK